VVADLSSELELGGIPIVSHIKDDVLKVFSFVHRQAPPTSVKDELHEEHTLFVSHLLQKLIMHVAQELPSLLRVVLIGQLQIPADRANVERQAAQTLSELHLLHPKIEQ
jgi:hypothetical protein